MKKIDYSGLGLEPHEIKVFSRELEILTSGHERYLDHRADGDYSPQSAVKYLTLAGWTDVKQNRLMIIDAIRERLPDFKRHEISRILHQVEERFKEVEGVFSETKAFRKKKPFYLSDTPAQGKKQAVVFPDGRVFDSLSQAAEKTGINRVTLTRGLRAGKI